MIPFTPLIAHRGASAYAPENTLSAFVEAALRDAKWVEFDVMQAASGELMIFHDETLHRTTNGKGYLTQAPYSYLCSLDAGSWFSPRFAGERIPTLSQVLDFLVSMQLSANIEIKASAGQDEALIRSLLKAITPFSKAKSTNFLFSSFSVPTLMTLRRLSKTAPIGLLMDTWLPDWQHLCKQLACTSLHVAWDMLTPDRAKKVKEEGLSLLCYTVNEVRQAEELLSWGVDAVFSDKPDMMLHYSHHTS